MKQNICVIGCGWLGLPLAKHLIENGYHVNGSTTSASKIVMLETEGVSPFIVQLTSEGVVGSITSCLAHCKTLILNIPPGLRKDPKGNYVQKIEHLITHIESSEIKQVLFIGSTSVFADATSIPIINETSPTARSINAKQLVAVEALFQKNKNFKTTILRFGGLFAEDRHPAKFLSCKTDLKNPDAPVNLIHRKDCIGIIVSILKHQTWNTVFNASTTPHPTRKNYYTTVCESLQIPIPHFEFKQKSEGKIINSEKLVRLLNYKFKVKL
ncbi:Nucleoside-diphosphate-sugar epimerase [Formosa sp. Hel1_31_208]|uniref:NAD(P)-binding domain-containing protein n=1 Tax=Formosa sp. Hel1_31_208 TaxID=1798225 RepID=UPI00087D30E8|nr:NAD(P)-binding domain-containing protein [Formosa sp. Hel1_31_208]SDR78770.1 Nucleoside-diphosphate-sugar epimerase [Formosa sp. Hel1_31_208]